MVSTPTRPRILVVEDSPVVADILREMLLDLGFDVVGPIGNFAMALEVAGSEQLDAAIIDVNIRGGKVYPVARTLAARQIPFIFASGYGDWKMPPELAGRPRLTKPFDSDKMDRELRRLIAAQSSEPPVTG